MKIVMCVPHHSEMIHTKAAISIWGQSLYCNNIIFPDSGSESLAVVRNNLVEKAFEQVPDFTHLLWLDGDEIFPQDMTQRLADHDKDIVAAWTVIRQDLKPNVYMIISKNKRGGYKHKAYSKKLINEHLKNNEPLHKVDRFGFGSVLIKRKVFKIIPEPWFYFDEHRTTEDLAFCDKAREMGFDLWVDFSLRCRHISLTYL